MHYTAYLCITIIYNKYYHFYLMATQKKISKQQKEYVTKSEFVRRINAWRHKNNPNAAVFTRPTLDRHIDLGGIKIELWGGNKLIDWNKYGSYPFKELPRYNIASRK